MYAVVLDLDRTLVYSSKTRDARFETFPVLDGTLWVHVRPSAGSLLRRLLVQPGVHVIVWTAGVRQYGKEIVDGLCDLYDVHDTIPVLCRDDTMKLRVNNTTVYAKDLKLVTSRFPSVTDAILVDDDPVHQRIASNRGRIVQVPPFHLDPTDVALVHLLLKLEILCRANETGATVQCPIHTRPVFFVPLMNQGEDVGAGRGGNAWGESLHRSVHDDDPRRPVDRVGGVPTAGDAPCSGRAR